MELHGERLIPAGLAATWAALNDPETLKACIAGCETLERVGDDAYTAVVALKIGPVSARFKGNLRMTDVTPPNGYTMAFDGQGGVAGFGKGSADVTLAAVSDASTMLSYAARATVGGKMAQIGSRLIDATAAKITDDFFKAFEAHLQAQRDAAELAVAPAEATAASATGADVLPSREALPGRVAPRGEPSSPRVGTLEWALAAAIVLAGLAWLLLR